MNTQPAFAKLEFPGFSKDADEAGWRYRAMSQIGRFPDVYGEMWIRVEDKKVRLRMRPTPLHRNLSDNLHGGLIVALIDFALFAGPQALGLKGAIKGVTIDLATQFFAPLRMGSDVDIVLEVLRETGRLIFSRGLVEQNGVNSVSFSGTIRKDV